VAAVVAADVELAVLLDPEPPQAASGAATSSTMSMSK
jgi:hypothetical protein